MRMRPVAGMLAVLALCAQAAWAAPCQTACKDEIAACATQECPGLRGQKLVRCKRAKCRKPIMLSCFHDPQGVCGATSARPPSAGGPPVLPGGW